MGKITRCTLGKLTVEAMESEGIPDSVTFECRGTELKKDQSEFKTLQHDKQTNIVANHKLGRLGFLGACVGILIALVLGVTYVLI